MINEENLNKMYDGIINNEEMTITTKELNSYGFNSKDLSDLIEQGILKREKRGYYSYLSVKDLYKYGRRLNQKKEYEKAVLCFEKCYQLNPNDINICFQLFFRNILIHDYENALKYFEILDDNDDEYYTSDNNLYIYLLNIITELPEKYKSYAKHIKYEDLKAKDDDKRFGDIVLENKIRKAIHNKKFAVAAKMLNKILNEKGTLNFQNIIVKNLLLQVKEVKDNRRNIILDMINNEEYQNIFDYLINLEEQIYLDKNDYLIKKIVQNLIYMNKTSKIPKIEIMSTDRFTDAVVGQNFELALSLMEKTHIETGLAQDENPIYLLLVKINEQLNKIKSEKNIDIEEEIENKNEKSIEKETIVLEPQPIAQNTNYTFIDITKYLMQQDLENAFVALRNYLENINKKQYEFLIVDLIKLSVIENDIAFTKPMIALTYISRDNYEFNISEYIQEFYVSLSKNKFEQARIYLDILSKSSNLGIECILTDSLEQVLNNTEQMLNTKKNDKIVTSEIVQPTLEREENVVSKVSTKEEKNKIKKEEKINVKENEINVAKLIDSKLDELINNGIVLLKPMDSETIRKIHKYVENMKNVKSFIIGSEDERQIVLKDSSYVEKFEHGEVKGLGDQAYRDKDYDTCIQQYKKLLIAYRQPKSYIFIKLGFAYMMKRNKNLAIDYLTVGNELNKLEKGSYNYNIETLLDSLKGYIDEENIKTYVRMSEEEFKDDVNDNYGIEDIDSIKELMTVGMTFEQACESLSFDKEKIHIIALVFAKEAYSQESYSLGDQYLKRVEKSKGKSPFVKSLFEEIKRNKRFYKNRKAL